MAASLKETLSELWFDINYWQYDLIKDLDNLTAEALEEKYLPLKDNPEFKKKYLNKGLLHQVITNSKKAIVLIELGYSLTDLDESGKSPIGAASIDVSLIESIDEIIWYFYNKKIKLDVFESDVDLIKDANVDNDIKDDILYLLGGVYFQIIEGDILNAIKWIETYHQNDKDFDIKDIRFNTNDLMDCAVLHNHSEAKEHLKKKGFREYNILSSTKNKTNPELLTGEKRTSLGEMVVKRGNNILNITRLDACFNGNGQHDDFNAMLTSLLAVYSQNMKIYVPARKSLPKNVTAGMLLKLISNYLRNNDGYDHKTLKFIWQYIAHPIYEKLSSDDQKQVAYFFKTLHINLSIEKTTSTENPVLAKAKSLEELHNEKTMLALNTGIWGGFGTSTLHEKLVEIVSLAKVTDESDPKAVAKLSNLIDEFSQMKDKRAKEYNAERYVNSTKNVIA